MAGLSLPRFVFLSPAIYSRCAQKLTDGLELRSQCPSGAHGSNHRERGRGLDEVVGVQMHDNVLNC
jgi:hypothetical protein